MTTARVFLFLLSILAGVANAQGTSTARDGAASRAKLVNRLYQATFGGEKFCRSASSEAATEFERELLRVKSSYPQLLKLLVEAPEYEAARLGFDEFLNQSRPGATTETLSSECRALASILRTLVDDSSGPTAVVEYQETLSK